MKYDIAAFVWPSYTGDEPRTRIFWEQGFGEWQTVLAMTDKGGYDGCRWPRKPLWGYVNEADPRIMEMQINAAVEHGVNVFIYDWYWFDNRPFLENCLNDGFLKARNNKDMKFYLMWANHNADHLWDKRNSDDVSEIIWRGDVSPQVFSEICDRTIEKYFKLDNYYKIEGCPVYMIFAPENFLRSFGSSEKCREAVEEFRKKVKAAGFKDLHLQSVYWERGRFDFLPEDDVCRGKTFAETLDYVGFDSYTSYNWGGTLRSFDGDYRALTDEYTEAIRGYSDDRKMTFYPNLTIGWDNNLRFKKFIPGVVKNNTPEAFSYACKKIKEFLDRELASGKLASPLITVNSWNEWTETSYLEPDDLYGYGYLEAIKENFAE
ncbi:MAG: glycoside hydrolase family 99-like domain-containing protein [Clostridiales bacterium]|nr:glycoside hydrolase family 99-like domain-containing protein [Clostridiales bacterium]